MEEDVFKVNRRVKARALAAVTDNFWSILKVMFIPTVLFGYLIINTSNNMVASVFGAIYGLLLLGLIPLASNLMALQDRQPLQAREYAKSWSWLILFKVWRNRLNLGADFVIVSLAFSLFTFFATLGTMTVPFVIMHILDGFAFLGLIFTMVFTISWTILLIWIAAKLGFLQLVFADAIFGDMDTTAFSDVEYARMTMAQRIALVFSTAWKMMTWSVFWRFFWLGLTFVGWFFMGFVTFFIGFIFAVPYLFFAVVAFYEQVLREKQEDPEVVPVATISTSVKVEVLNPKA